MVARPLSAVHGDNGVVVGASYTDVHVELPVLWMLVGLAAASSVALWINMRRRSYRLPAVLPLLVFGSAFAFAVIYPSLFQRFYVKPSELRLETPYIEHTIALTRQAYGLAKIEVKPSEARQGLTRDSLQANRATIDNIRLWDVQPLMDTYAQLQEIRTYYKVLSVDIDRYQLDAGYRQVVLSARELDPAMLPPNARIWVNLHLIFTHGIGVVMSPVTEKSTEGSPSFYLRDIPPVSNGGPAIREPRLYFSEGRQDYVIVNGNVAEFDYPKGADNAYTTYSGRDGVSVGSVARALFPWQLDDPNILLSRLYHRPEPDPASPQHSGPREYDRVVPESRPRPLCRRKQWAPVLDPGRLHRQPVVSLLPAGFRRRRQLHPQRGQGRGRRVQRHGRFLRQ